MRCRLPKAHWIKLPSWLNYTITLNQTVFSWGASSTASLFLTPIPHFVHFSTSLSVIISLRIVSIYSHIPRFLPPSFPLAVPTSRYLIQYVCAFARLIFFSLAWLYSLTFHFLYSFFPQAGKIRNVLLFPLTVHSGFSRRREDVGVFFNGSDLVLSSKNWFLLRGNFWVEEECVMRNSLRYSISGIETPTRQKVCCASDVHCVPGWIMAVRSGAAHKNIFMNIFLGLHLKTKKAKMIFTDKNMFVFF